MYQVLARKYRPKNFHELLGQSHVSTALINGIEQQRLHHAYLFTGTRGVGKTTIARILAKCLNCETGVTSEPCGVCSTCVAIDAGRFIDLIEIDAASRTKVEDTRELLDNVPYAPTQGRYKVYLIDEVHMLSTHSFNALLKTLEEPPEHVKFLLATTDPQKLPITIISRCLQFVLRPIPQVQLADYLAVILQKEHITFSPDALWQLASSAKGSVRDALSLTDQAIAFGNGQIEPATVKSMLGLIDQADVVGLLLAIVQQQKLQITQYIQQLREQVVDAKAVFDSMAEILHQVALLQVLPDFDLQLNSEQTQARHNLAQTIPADLLQLYYEIVVQSRENIGLANTPLQALEMCILRLLTFRPLAVNEVALNPAPIAQTDMPQIETPLIENSAQASSQENFIEKKTADSGLENLSHKQVHQENLVIQANISQENSFTDSLQIYDNHEIVANENYVKNLDDLNNLNNLDDTDTLPQNFDINQNQILDSSEEKPENKGMLQENFVQNFANQPTVITENALNHANNSTSQNLQENIASSTNSLIVEHSPTINQQDISPLSLLEPAPQDLAGEWTPQKWDYWVYQARVNDWLKGDELSLAKQGVMVGDMAGKSYFLINKESTKQQEKAFQDLCNNLTTHFSHMQVFLLNTQHNSNELTKTINLQTDTPDSLQSLRRQKAIKLAEQKITQEPVMQALLGENARVHNLELLK